MQVLSSKMKVLRRLQKKLRGHAPVCPCVKIRAAFCYLTLSFANFLKERLREGVKKPIESVIMIIQTIQTIWYFFLYLQEKVPIGKSTNMVLFPKERVPYSTWYFFPLVLFPVHQIVYPKDQQLVPYPLATLKCSHA